LASTEEKLRELEEKVRKLQLEKRVGDYITPEMGLSGEIPEEIVAAYYGMSLSGFVEVLRKNAYETDPSKKVGYINAIAGKIGLPYGEDNVWTLPDAHWEPNLA